MPDETAPLPRTSDLGGWLSNIDRHLAEPLNPRQRQQLLSYARLLREWNEKLNLTAILDDEGIAVRHFQDSLTLVPAIRSYQASHPGTTCLADVGTGAGFPGLVLKVACPEVEVVLIDALNKRLKFLEAVIVELGLTGISTIHARAEDAGRMKNLRERFDLVVARAVASLPILAEYCLPLVRLNGQFIAMKAQADEEIDLAHKALNVLGGSLHNVQRFLLPGTDMQRTLIQVAKVKMTPPAYPRKAGKVEQNPLQ